MTAWAPPVGIDLQEDGPQIDATCTRCGERLVVHKDVPDRLGQFLANHLHQESA